MRSIWNGSISFGLVTIPVKTYSATDRTSSVSFVRIHEKDGAQIRYRKICELDGEEVPNEEVGKGYQAPDDETIVQITDEDLARLPMPAAKTMAILAFVDADEIDPLQLDKAYYLGPNGSSAARPYAVLREALEHQRKVAIGKVAIRGRESLAMLRAHDGAIVMHSLLWPDQIRPAAGVGPRADVKLRENEFRLAEMLMDSLGELDPAELHDEYREAVEELVAQKLEGGTPVAPAGPPGGQVVDLMAALEKSVEAARQGGGAEPGGAASVTPIRGRTAGKKAAKAAGPAPAGKKAAAKRPAAKKSPAKKTTTAQTSDARASDTESTGTKSTGTKGARKTAAKATAGSAAAATAKKPPAKRAAKKASA
ncbi:Ku protein [Streptomyces chattanoogensis]|uniref:Non-homologous end joining protein Ku n=1 Tax=Streptomyces chattanoogensis TaxID=66876 RepID=A0A0N1JX21_9ACTN|nr:Ku protein [Streptomyces chattanoogensis]KPC60703.1 DNA repair protein [Streptomyces chattanoogensis]